MFHTTAAIVGSNLIELLMKIAGSDVMRTLFSFIIRQFLARYGF